MTHTCPEPLVGAVYGLRWFNYSSDEGILRGPAYPQPTLDAVNVAICAYRSHQAPAPDCRCGFYAYDIPPGRSNQWRRGDGNVACIVELSGRIVVAERGLRAEKLRPVAVAAPPEGFATNYPRVMQFASEEAMLSEFPVSDLPRQPRDNGFLDGPGGRWLLRGLISLAAVVIMVLGVIPLLGAPYVAALALTWAVTTATVSPIRLVAVGVAATFAVMRMEALLDFSLGTIPDSWSIAATVSNWTPIHPFSAIPEELLRQTMTYGFVGLVVLRSARGFVRWCRAKSEGMWNSDEDQQIATRAWRTITRQPRIEGQAAGGSVHWSDLSASDNHRMRDADG